MTDFFSHWLEVVAEPPQEKSISGPKGPVVSMATVVKMWQWSGAMHYSRLLHLARATCKLGRCQSVWKGGVPHQEPAT